MQSRLRPLVLVTAVVVSVLPMAVSPVANAATRAGWSGSRALATNFRHGWVTAQTVVDGRGDAATVWQDNENHPGGDRHLHAATRDAGGRWSAPHLLAFRGHPGDAQGANVAIAGHGRAVVVWSDYSANPTRLLWAQHSAGGSWSPTRMVPNQPTTGYVSFTMSTTGWGVLAYSHNGVAYVRKLTPQSTWQAPVRVSAANPPRNYGADYVRAAIGTDRSIVASWDWVHQDNHLQEAILHAQRGGLTSSGARLPVVDDWSGTATQPQVTFAHSASGNAVAAISGNRLVFRLADGVWRRYQIPVTAGADRSLLSDVALTDSAASVYWSTNNSDRSQTLYVADFANGTWSAPQVVHAFAPYQIFLSAEATRTTTRRVVAWTAESTPHDAKSYSVHVQTTSGGQTSDRTLAPKSYDVSVAATGNHAALAYSRVNGTHYGDESLFTLTR